MDGWHNVSRLEKCPVCGHDSWCSVSDDGEVCVCRRTESQWPTKSGTGWIHRLKENAARWHRPPSQPAPGPTPAEHFAALPRGNEQVRLSRYLMREISLPCDMILAMDVRWDNKAKAAAFPMRDAEGNVTGIRYRQLKTGRKWSLKGSKDGLFYIPGLFSAADGDLVACEGPTDMLAAASCGITNVVGRSSCMTGAAHIREMMRLMKCDSLTVVADDDTPKPRPDGTTWKPGLDGAKKLCTDVGRAYRIVFPAAGFKDLREWYEKGGMTGEEFRAAAAGAKWRVPEIGVGEEAAR